MKRNVKQKNKKIFFFIVLPIVVTCLFYFIFYQVITFINKRDESIFMDGYEVGRYVQLNEDAENTKAEIKVKQESSRDTLLKNLARLESLNGAKRKILDTNNKYSLGLYHFQAATVKDLYRRYYKKQISTMEAVNIANDDILATQLAHDAIFIHKEYYHWKISLCKLNVIKNNCLSQKEINNLFANK